MHTCCPEDIISVHVGLQVKLGIPGGEAMASAAAEMLIPLKRIGTPDEAAGAMLLLASPYASFISGQVGLISFLHDHRGDNKFAYMSVDGEIVLPWSLDIALPDGECQGPRDVCALN